MLLLAKILYKIKRRWKYAKCFVLCCNGCLGRRKCDSDHTMGLEGFIFCKDCPYKDKK